MKYFKLTHWFISYKKVHGQVMHYTAKSLIPDENKKPSYSQLFIMDTKEATETRMNHPANKKCLPQLINLKKKKIKKQRNVLFIWDNGINW